MIGSGLLLLSPAQPPAAAGQGLVVPLGGHLPHVLEWTSLNLEPSLSPVTS